MSDVRVVLCTFPKAEVARQIGTLLIEKQLVACINLIPAVESIYRWQGKVERDSETLAILKTTAAALPSLQRELLKQHPYEVPEFIALDPDSVSGPYADWLQQNASGPDPTP